MGNKSRNIHSKETDLHYKPDALLKTKRSALIKLTSAGALIAAAPVLPKQWVKPVIETVMLPVHAETSEDSDQMPGENTTTAAPTTTTTAAPTTSTTTTTTTGARGGSDIRLKTDISQLCMTDSGFNLYKFRYINDPDQQEYVGIMAQDIVNSHPEALTQDARGFYAVRYELLGLKMTSYDEWQKSGIKSVLISPNQESNVVH